MAARPILPLILCSATAAHASPRTDPTAGRAVFTGATVANTTAITLNPAAAGLGSDGRGAESGEVFIALTGALDQLTIDRKHLDPDTGALTAGERAQSSIVEPGALIGVVIRAADRYTLGVQAATPPRESFIGGFEPLRYHTLGGGQRDYLATISGTIRITRAFYFGASLTHDNTLLDLRYARDTALASGNLDADCGGERCGVENPAADERYAVSVKSAPIATSNLRVNVGLVARLWRDIWLGVAYHTPPGFAIQSALAGKVEVTRAPRDGGEVLHGGSTVYVSYPASVDFELRAPLPRQLDLHVGGRWEDLSRMQAYDVRAYNSTFVANGIPEWTLRPRGMHDSLALWAGLEQVATDVRQRYRFGGRVGYETASLDDNATSPLTIAPPSFTIDGGAAVRFGQSWLLQLSYGVQLFAPVSVTASAFDPRSQLACIASDHDYSTRGCQAVRDGYAIPTAAGDYTRIQHALRLGLRYELP